MADQSITIPGSKPGLLRNIAGWILCGLLALIFIMVGSMKLIGQPAVVQEFDQAGIGVLIPRFSGWAASLLAVVMCGAVVAHLTVLHSPPTLPAVLAAMALAAAWLRR